MTKDLGKLYLQSWPEIYAVILIVVGFLIAISIRSSILNYIVILLAGGMSGRLIFESKKKGMFPYFLIIIGFLLGFMLGSIYISKRLIVFFFVLGIMLSYYIHKKGYIK